MCVDQCGLVVLAQNITRQYLGGLERANLSHQRFELRVGALAPPPLETRLEQRIVDVLVVQHTRFATVPDTRQRTVREFEKTDST